MEKNENKRLTDKIIEALRTSALEMEKLQVKMALGTSEAKDSYEDIKKKLNLFLHDAKHKIKTGKETVEDVHAKIDHLLVQLNLGKTETIEAFNKQKKELLQAIHELEVKITSNEKLKKAYAFVLVEIETFKIQLAMLERRFNKQMSETDASFKKGRDYFLEVIEKLKAKYGLKKETKWENFQSEVSDAFQNFKKAFN